MPVSGDIRRLKGWGAHVKSLGKPNGPPQRAIAKAVGNEIRGLLKEEFARGIGPDGRPWKLTKRGRPALISKKLPGDFKTSPVANGVFTSSRVKWLRAHHEGHVFPARSQVLTFSKKGRLLSEKRQRRAKLVFDVTARVGQRVLAERPIYPVNRMTGPWGKGVNRGIALGVKEWRARTGL